MGAYSIGMKRLAAAVLLSWSGVAPAGMTANLGVVSEYMLRGIDGSDGAALQGGVDWAGASGVYLGTWASDIGGPAVAGTLEVDLYAGWAGTLGATTLDVGAAYYFYKGDKEDLGRDIDYPELYAELGLGWLTLQLYYTTLLYGEANEAAADLAGKDTDGLYASAIGTFALSETTKLAVQVGHSSGDGVEVAYGRSYADYSVSLTRAFEGNWSVLLGLYDATLSGAVSGGGDPTALVGVKKVFEL